MSEIAFHVSDVSEIGVQVSLWSEIAVQVSGVSFSLTHFNLADATTLDMAAIVASVLVIKLIAQLTVELAWTFADANISANAEA